MTATGGKPATLDGGGHPWWLRELLPALLVVLTAAAILRAPSLEQDFSIDESRWISGSRYFWVTFVERDLFGEDWQPNYVILTHPPVARYLIGFGLWVQGWTPDQLNGRYDSLQSWAFNSQAGNIPSERLLAAARRVTFLFAVTAVGLVYAVGRQLGGRLAGVGAAAFALASPLLSTLWTRALAESILAAFSLLALALALRSLPRLGPAMTLAWLPAATGATLALAAATKLSGGVAGLGLAAFALIQQVFSLARTGRPRGLRFWFDLVLTGVVVFVAVNPLLYVRPAERAVALVRHRQDEMRFQQQVFASQAVPSDLGARVRRVGQRLFGTYATPAGPLPVSPDAFVVAAGLWALLWQVWRELRRRETGPAVLLACWLLSSYAVTTANLGFDSSHYYAPLAALNAVLAGLALGVGWRLLRDGLLLRVRARQRAPAHADQNTQTPVT